MPRATTATLAAKQQSAELLRELDCLAQRLTQSNDNLLARHLKSATSKRIAAILVQSLEQQRGRVLPAPSSVLPPLA